MNEFYISSVNENAEFFEITCKDSPRDPVTNKVLHQVVPGPTKIEVVLVSSGPCNKLLFEEMMRSGKIAKLVFE